MIQKINVSHIVRDHLLTLSNYRTGKIVPGDFIVFFGFPLLIATLLVFFERRLSSSAISILSTGLAIFAGLLFNLLLLVADVAVRTDGAEGAASGTRTTFARIKLVVLEELHANVAFAILVSLVSLVSLLALSIFSHWPGKWMIEAPIYYLAIMFFLTLLMILKRAHAVIAKEVDSITKRNVSTDE